jgi:uncharacterized membrane protein YvlD (DUF360 family)
MTETLEEFLEEVRPFYWVIGAIILVLLQRIFTGYADIFDLFGALVLTAAISLFLGWLKEKFGKKEEPCPE